MSDLEKDTPCKKRVKLHKKFHSEIMRWLRKAFSWSGIITECKSFARVKRGVYECQYKGCIIGPKEFEIDHFLPCIDVKDNWTTGYDYNEIVSRMFDRNNCFLVCKPCHRAKTGQENSKRKKGVPKRDSEKKTTSEATKKEYKEGRKKKVNPKRVKCSNGKIYSSVGDCAKDIKGSAPAISRCARKKDGYKKHRGLTFEYIN